MIPDPSTPDRGSKHQSPPAHAPEGDQADPAIGGGQAGTSEVSTHDAPAGRTGEAGNQYVGRQMDDDLKSEPRVDDARQVEGDA